MQEKEIIELIEVDGVYVPDESEIKTQIKKVTRVEEEEEYYEDEPVREHPVLDFLDGFNTSIHFIDQIAKRLK